MGAIETYKNFSVASRNFFLIGAGVAAVVAPELVVPALAMAATDELQKRGAEKLQQWTQEHHIFP